MMHLNQGIYLSILDQPWGATCIWERDEDQDCTPLFEDGVTWTRGQKIGYLLSFVVAGAFGYWMFATILLEHFLIRWNHLMTRKMRLTKT